VLRSREGPACHCRGSGGQARPFVLEFFAGELLRAYYVATDVSYGFLIDRAALQPLVTVGFGFGVFAASSVKRS
jgi:hypothetical protein